MMTNHHDHNRVLVGASTLAIDAVEDPAELRVSGRLDGSNSEGLLRAIVDLRASGIWDIVLDVERLAFVDSNGLGALLEARRCGPVALRSPSPQVRHLLQVTKLDELIGVVD